MLVDALNFYSISMKDSTNRKHVLGRKCYKLSKNLNRKCEKKSAKFLFLEVFAEKRWQFLAFHGLSLQVECGLVKPENFEKSLSLRETSGKMAS